MTYWNSRLVKLTCSGLLPGYFLPFRKAEPLDGMVEIDHRLKSIALLEEAASVEALAVSAQDPEVRDTFRVMAEHWRALADLHLRLVEKRPR